jgi:hypothetical protein
MTAVPGTPLMDEQRRGEFRPLNDLETTRELRELVSGLELEGTIFRSNHASNALPLEGTLPRDKARLVATLDAVLADEDAREFVPPWLRGL